MILIYDLFSEIQLYQPKELILKRKTPGEQQQQQQQRDLPGHQTSARLVLDSKTKRIFQ